MLEDYVLSSALLVSPSENVVTLDEVIQHCGSLNRFQYFHYFFLNLIPITSGIIAFYYVYGVAEPLHRCHLPDTIWLNDQYHPFNSTHQYLIDLWIPTQDKCTIRKPLSSNLSQPSNETIACIKWVYDRTVFGRTFTEDANFVCLNSVKRSFLSSALQMGAMFVLFTGQLGDKIGRRKSIQIISIILLTTCVVTQILLQFVPMTINTKFGLLLLNQFVSGIDSYMIVFVLLMELTNSTHTSFAGNLALVTFTLGEIIVTLFAYLCKSWLLLKWAVTFFILLIVPYLYFIPESPYWLYSKQKYDQLEIQLRQIAEENRQQESNWFPYYQKLLKNPADNLQSEMSRGHKIKRLMTHSPIMSKLLISGAIGFTAMLLYIKISYGLAAMENVNPYLNIIIGAIVESIGYLSAWVLMTKIGRKRSLLFYILLTTVCVLMIPSTIKYNPVITVSIAQLGKLAISGAVCVSYIYVPELFPTTIRSGASGFFACIGRIGAIIAPLIDTSLKEKDLHITFYIYALLAIIILGLTFVLPETKNQPFQDKIDYTKKKLKKTTTNNTN
ncbi:unnamed protein product [Didymodactylos carnosus]|uniref:Major facilitator superfamily (MFS) profile domain-containing protein n=1 Tax=Didymodactylos carnosus TaxID=1234261 RepID=A0A8S2K570_9BILA|nr:unnamed protein product [Didymodactylos carnosus]CAF3835868.1 unnamed protein product [Didymodactylos carnosus]